MERAKEAYLDEMEIETDGQISALHQSVENLQEEIKRSIKREIGSVMPDSCNAVSPLLPG